MTITLPTFVEIMGCLGCGAVLAVVVYMVVGFMAVMFMDSSELGSIMAVLLVPLTVAGFIGGVVLAATLLV